MTGSAGLLSAVSRPSGLWRPWESPAGRCCGRPARWASISTRCRRSGLWRSANGSGGARAYTGKTQLEVEEETGISHPTIVRYEKGILGNTRPANWYVIKTLAACYGVTPEWILGEED